MKLNLRKNKKLGFTLIEILLVVGFIAVAGIGVYTVYSKVQQGQAANNEARNIDTMRAGIKNLMAGSSTTAALTAAAGNTIINNASITPQPMRGAAITDITNSFGGVVVIQTATLVAAGDGFSITYPAVPNAVCVKLATGTGAQFERVSVGGVNVKALGTNTSPDVVAVTTECAKDVGAGVTMLFESLK